ncbi:MAG TPA: FG-GAP-like repeat-containing protein [Terriglobales bacterium]
MLWSICRLVLTASMLACLSAPATSQVTFTNRIFVTGPEPTNVVSGDFNRDGLPDLAVTDQIAGSVTILLGVGGGSFAFGQEISTGLNPTQIVTGDFNHDGNLDLAVALSEADAVEILLGNGNGTFHQGISIALDGNPFAMVAADFTHTGVPDLAIIEHTPADTFTLKIFHSNGNGTFTRAQAIPLPGKPIFSGLMVTDDFNIDGLPDLAVATDTTIMVFTDSPNGTLHLHSVVSPPNTGSIVGLAAGRLTPGAAPDLVVRVFDNVNDTSSPNSIYAFLNTGSGTFHLKSRVSTAGFGGSVYLADVDGDGLADLINVGGNFRNGTVDIALGHGDGTFAAPVTVENNIIGSLGGLVARDLNLDSRHDLAIAGDEGLGTGDEATHVLINQNARANCDPPPSSSLAVRICSPAANAGVRSTFTVTAGGNSPEGVKRMELWVDGVKRAQNFSDQLRATVKVSLGTHRVTVVGVDLYDNLVKMPILVHAF